LQSSVIHQTTLQVSTRGRGSYLITDRLQEHVVASQIQTGLCHLFLHHTSASLVICENADPDVREDMERFMSRLVPDGDRMFSHNMEGPDDMPAHIRSLLTHTDLTIPVSDGRCALGIWQGVYLWEHRKAGHRREITITVSGD
jgi:secondary thiamine-phosphate synthase enzyme